MNKKRCLVLVLAAVMVLTFAGTTLAADQPTVQKLTLQQAVDLALKNNVDLEKARQQVIIAEVQKKQAASAAKSMQDTIKDSPISIYSMISAQEVDRIVNLTPMQATKGVDIAKITLDFNTDVTKFTVAQQYWSVAMAGETEKLAFTALERAQKQLSDAQAKYKVGVSAKVDVLQAEVNAKQAKADLNSKRAATLDAKMKLCATIGLPINQDISPIDKLVFNELKIDNRAAKEKALFETNRGYKMQTLSYELEELTFKYKAGTNTPNTYEYQLADATWKNAQGAYKQAGEQLKISIQTTLNNLSVGQENYQAMLAARDAAAEAYRLTALRYQAGLATWADMLSAEQSLKQAENGVLGLLFQYNMTKEQIEYGILGGSAAA